MKSNIPNINYLNAIPISKEVLDRINAGAYIGTAPKPKESETYRVMLYYDYQGWDFMGNEFRTRKDCEDYMRTLIEEDKYNEYEYMVVKIENYYTNGVEYVGEELEEKLAKEDI